ncbi:MAG: NlpC/P60 family protein [Patulibacter sp.]
MSQPFRLRLLLAAALAILGLPTAAAAASVPMLASPVDVQAGHLLSVTATTATFGLTCSLQTTSPTGVLRQSVLTGLHTSGSGARGVVRSDARPGTWTLQLRCGSRAAAPVRLRVIAGQQPGRSSRLVASLRAYRFSTKRPTGLRTPAADQDGSGAPAFSAAQLDGLGASTSERAARALQWALRQVGRTDYALWCLRFVANAYNADQAGYPTAQSAADALDLHNRGGSPKSAPAGSLVFFHVAGASGASYGHVGLSLGDGRMISAQDTVKIERIRDVPLWRTNYLGWAWPPAAWPGFPPTAPQPAATPLVTFSETPSGADAALPAATDPTPTPAAAAGRVTLIVDNRNTNGLVMVEDAFPLRLQTRPWSYCGLRACFLPTSVDPGRFSGGVYDAAICQTHGDVMTNGNWGDTSDDANPELFTSDRWYGIELADGTFGYISEIWVQARFRGGLGLPECPPYPSSDPATQATPTPAVTPTPTPADEPSSAAPSAVRVPIVTDNRYVVDATTMAEDTAPVQLQTRPWTYCGGPRDCYVPLSVDPGRVSGESWDAAICWTWGDEYSNGSAFSGNPEQYSSRRYYGVELPDGTFGYVPEVWIRAADRGGLGLPYCPAYDD